MFFNEIVFVNHSPESSVINNNVSIENKQRIDFGGFSLILRAF